MTTNVQKSTIFLLSFDKMHMAHHIQGFRVRLLKVILFNLTYSETNKSAHLSLSVQCCCCKLPFNDTKRLVLMQGSSLLLLVYGSPNATIDPFPRGLSLISWYEKHSIPDGRPNLSYCTINIIFP
jgi:hypothetical protein